MIPMGTGTVTALPRLRRRLHTKCEESTGEELCFRPQASGRILCSHQSKFSPPMRQPWTYVRIFEHLVRPALSTPEVNSPPGSLELGRMRRPTACACREQGCYSMLSMAPPPAPCGTHCFEGGVPMVMSTCEQLHVLAKEE